MSPSSESSSMLARKGSISSTVSLTENAPQAHQTNSANNLTTTSTITQTMPSLSTTNGLRASHPQTSQASTSTSEQQPEQDIVERDPNNLHISDQHQSHGTFSHHEPTEIDAHRLEPIQQSTQIYHHRDYYLLNHDIETPRYEEDFTIEGYLNETTIPTLNGATATIAASSIQSDMLHHSPTSPTTEIWTIQDSRDERIRLGLPSQSSSGLQASSIIKA